MNFTLINIEAAAAVGSKADDCLVITAIHLAGGSTNRVIHQRHIFLDQPG